MDTTLLASERARALRKIPFFFWAAERVKAQTESARHTVVVVLHRKPADDGTEPQTAA